MSEANRRGLGCLAILVVILFLCALVTFSWLPAIGAAGTLPVIVVPGEPFLKNWPIPGLPLTNTWVAVIITDLIIIFVGIAVWRQSKGWTRQVPTRLQSVVELLGEFMWGQTRSFAGVTALARNWLYPLAATIFVFLLVANLFKLVPGVESVGVLHCAGHADPEAGFTIRTGYPAAGNSLWNPRPLFAGYNADEANYEACEEYKEGKIAKPSQDALNVAAGELTATEARINADKALTAAERDTQITNARLEAAESVWAHAKVPLTPDELKSGIVPYIFVVTPYVRGATTDLNLPLALALIVFVAIQVFGVAAQGPNYFQKFINVHALGTIQKKPLGAVDFLVGLFEIVSELGKVISLTFRLFGNLFAGTILLAVMAFLVAGLVPLVFYGLEIIVGSIQAYVFAILTIVFSAQAMQGHHSDDEHHEEHAGTAAEEAHHPEPINRNVI
jgi:F0F1-type ATP synthase membrane subunit a